MHLQRIYLILRDPKDNSVKTESREFQNHPFTSNSDILSTTFLCFIQNFGVKVSGFAEFKVPAGTQAAMDTIDQDYDDI
jgi:hypothetical protein